MLKNKINKALFDTLPADVQKEYTATGDVYILQHDEDTGALTRALERERDRANGLTTELVKEQTAHGITKAQATQHGTPLEIATRSKAEALAEVKPQLERLTKLETAVKTSALTAAAESLAVKIGGEANKIALLPHIERRLQVELDAEDKPAIVVTDGKGAKASIDIVGLEKEIRADKNLAPLVVVSKASGTVTPPTQAGKQSNGSGATQTEKFDFNKATPQERQAYIAAKYTADATATQ